MSEKGFGVRLTASVDQYVAAMARAEASTVGFTSSTHANMQKVGGQLTQVGGLLTRNVTLPLVAAGVGALKLSSDFNTAFSRMVGLAGVTAGEVDGLKDSVLELAGRTGKAPVELANALYMASSAGLDTSHAMEAVERAAVASASGMGSAEDVVGLVASALASYGAANITAAEATDVLTAAIKEGRADPEELAGSLGRVLPIASQLGITFGEVGGATAYLSNIFGDTARTVTALQGFMVKLVSPSKQGQQVLHDMGTSAQELQAAIDQNGLLGALDLLREHGFADNQQALRGLFDDIEGFQGALALLNDNSGTLVATLDKVSNSTGAADKAFDNASKTGTFQLKKAWAETQAALIHAGDIILPIVADIAGAIGHLADIFSDLPTPVQTAIVAILGVVALAGPVIVMAGSVVKNFTLIQTAVAGASTSMGTFATVAGAAAAALGGLLIAQQAVALFDQLADRTGDSAKQMNAFLAAYGDVGKNSAGTFDLVNSFTALSQAIQDTTPFEDLAGDMAHWQTDAEFNFRSMAKAFDDALASSPAAASALVDQLEEVSAQADAGNTSARKWMEGWAVTSDTIAGWRTEVDNATAAQDVLTKGVTGGTDAVTGLGDATNELGDATGTAARKSFEWDDAVRALATDNDETANAIQRATDALNDQVAALDADLKSQMALIDFARGAADAQYALARSTDAYGQFLEDLPGKITDVTKSKDSEAEKQRQLNELYRSGTDAATKMADDTVNAFNEASDGTLSATQKLDIWNQSMLAAAQQASGPARQAILDYISATNEIPPEIATYVAALVDQGKLTEAQQLLDDTSAPRESAMQVVIDQASVAVVEAEKARIAEFDETGVVSIEADTRLADAQFSLWLAKWSNTGLVVDVTAKATRGAHADGGFVGGPMLSTLGEGGLPEVVLPLTKPGRINALMSDPRVFGPIFGALGLNASAEGRVVNISHTTIPAAVVQSASVSVGSAATPDNDDELMARKFKRGLISMQEYDAYLAVQQSHEEQFSDREDRLWEIREGLKRDQIEATRRAADDAAQAAKDAAEAEQVAKDAALAREDARMQWLYDHQQISAAQYQEYLGGKLAGEELFSQGWIAIHAQMDKIRDDETAKARQADKDRIESMFTVMRVQQDLNDAIRQQAETYQDLQDKAATAFFDAMDPKSTAEERASSEAAYQAALRPAANAVIAGADARANAEGISDNTPEWAAYMRSAITGWMPGHDDLAPYLNQFLATLPSFADGGYMPATPGGAIVRVADRGVGEWMIPADKMMAGSWSGGSTIVHHYSIRVEAPPTYDAARGARDLVEQIDRHLIRNGATPISART